MAPTAALCYLARMIPRLVELASVSRATSDYLDALRAAGFAGDIAADAASRVVGSTDNSIYQILPQALVYPRNSNDVRLLFRVASDARFKDLSFTARGGGTGTNGQSLTAGIVVDLARHMAAIGHFDAAAGWVEVEPGVVKDQLNAFLEPHGVFFAPDLSPSSRATVGGMIATDACGQGSRVYGKTSQHVLGLELVLVDGSTVWLEDLSPEKVAEARNAGGPLARLLDALVPIARDNRQRFIDGIPRLQRFVTGYHLERVVDPATGHVGLHWLVTGAEGTLGIVTRARVRVTPIPTARRLAVLEFGDFESALASARAVVASDPSAIETIDEKVMGLARGDVIIHSVRQYLPERDPPTRAINLVEYEGTDIAVCEARLAALLAECEQHRGERGWPTHWSVAANDTDREALWNLRKKGVGLLGNAEGRRKPVPFVEDTVVPPERLADYVREFRGILEAEGLEYGMFGHVDVGCLHVRPLLDLRDPEDEKRIRRISDKVSALCRKYGGVIWGEHGKGFRSEYSPDIFGDLFDVICAVKAVFDPDNRLNPGKIATPPDRKHELATIDQPLRGHFDRQVAARDQATFAKAIDCNGNGQCFHWDPDHLMCPSSKVTRDRIHTPKGRAGVMREWLRQLSNNGHDLASHPPARGFKRLLGWPRRAMNGLSRRFGRYDYSHEVARAMKGCLACKACATQCPVKVDVPVFRADFLAHYHDRYPRPLRDHLVAGLEGSLATMGRLPRLFHWLFKRRVFQAALGRVIGLVDSPAIAREPQKKKLQQQGFGILDEARLEKTSETQRRVILLQDAFTSYYEPEIVAACARLLRELGFAVDIAPFFPNGKGMHVKGFLPRFERLVQKNHKRLQALAGTGATLVGIDPAVTLTYRDEYAKVAREHGLGTIPKVQMLQEFLAGDGLSSLPPAAAPHTTLAFFGHCTERALQPASDRQWKTVFARFGIDARPKAVGCCGMSGAFGHEREHRDESQGIFEMSWARYLPEDPTTVAASGYSCRSQVERFRGGKPQHPALVLLAALERQRAEIVQPSRPTGT